MKGCVVLFYVHSGGKGLGACSFVYCSSSKQPAQLESVRRPRKKRGTMRTVCIVHEVMLAMTRRELGQHK